MPVSPEASARCAAILAACHAKEEQLRQLSPYLIDLSLRENPFGSRVGQTLEQKLAILPRLRAFGFTNILLGTLDYPFPEEHEVDDDFMQHLRDHGIDMTGGFAFTDTGTAVSEHVCLPSESMKKLRDYGVPNTLHEIYLSREGMKDLYTLEQLERNLGPSIRWLLENVKGDHGGVPRIIINVVDGCDAFAEQPEVVCRVLDLLAAMNASGTPVEGVSFEDDRGTFMPFQVGAYVACAREHLPPPMKLLVHMHSGGGFENGSLIEALLNGADGVWGGLPKRAAIIGHASLGELIANLMRVGNQNVQRDYRVKELIPLSTSLQEEDDLETIPEDLPILGTNAYRVTLDFFRQLETRFMDLVPEAIGGKTGYRVCPLGSDATVLSGRLAEVLGENGRPQSPFSPEVLKKMIVLMRRDLRAGRRLVYDEPAQLIDLYQRAGGHDGAR
jgi:hypothetical protein